MRALRVYLGPRDIGNLPHLRTVHCWASAWWYGSQPGLPPAPWRASKGAPLPPFSTCIVVPATSMSASV